MAFNKGKKFGGGGRNFGGNRGGNRGFGGGRDRDRAQMHKATCSDCGKSCEVPFRPTGEKPVFCNDCFGDKRDNNSGNFRGGDRGAGILTTEILDHVSMTIDHVEMMVVETYPIIKHSLSSYTENSIQF